MKELSSLLLTALCGAILASCGAVKPVPVETRTEIRYIDSTIVHIDSVSVEIPVERYINITPNQFSSLETSVASSEASVDSLGLLHHSLLNKAVSLKKEVVYQDRLVYKDSLVYKETPVEVVVEKQVRYIPRWVWYSLGISILALLYIAWRLYKFLR